MDDLSDTSPALQAAIDFDQAGGVHTPAFLPLPDHMRRLRRALVCLEAEMAGTGLSALSGVVEMLRVAAALYDVRADTAIDDSAIFYCGAAMAYENANSVVASRYLAATIMFNFSWMALEEMVRSYAPPSKLPAGARAREVFKALPECGIDVDSSLKLAWAMCVASNDMQKDLTELTSLLTTAPRSEIALELVRRIRNSFAHGNISAPTPLDWEDERSPPANPQVDRFFAATRLILLLIASLVISRLEGVILEPGYDDPVFDADGELLDEAPADWYVRTVHLQTRAPWVVEPLILDPRERD